MTSSGVRSQKRVRHLCFWHSEDSRGASSRSDRGDRGVRREVRRRGIRLRVLRVILSEGGNLIRSLRSEGILNTSKSNVVVSVLRHDGGGLCGKWYKERV